MQGQGDGSDSSINPDQSQCQSIHELLDQESPSSLISRMVQSGISPENQRRAFVELMNHVDAELTARGIGFQRSNPGTANNGPLENGPSMEQQGNVSAALTDSYIDLNEAYQGNSNHSMKPDELEAADQNLRDVNSSHPILISSGGSLLEDEKGDSTNGRLPSFKRRATEDASRQLLLGESSRSENDFAAHENASGALNDQSNDNHLGQLEDVTGVGMGADSAMNGTQNAAGEITVFEAGIGGAPTVNHHQPSPNGYEGGYVMNHSLNVARNGIGNQDSIRARQEEIQRNIRLRRNPNLQDFTLASLTHNTMNSQVQPPSQTAMFFPHDHFVNSRIQPVHIAPTPQFVQLPEPFQTQQVQVQITGQGLTMSRPTQQEYFWNNPRNVIFPEGFEPGNLPHVTANRNLGNRNTNFPGNAAQDDSDSNSRISAVPIWYPRQGIRYSNRMQEILRRGETRRLQGDYRSAHAGSAAAAAEDTENSARGGNMRPRIRLRRSRLMPRAERQDADYPDSPRSGQQLVSDVHNALELVRRGGGLRFESVMMLNHSVLLGLPEEDDDVHEDMRLDIDDMTYEELIALGDEIGNASTGLREDAILANLRVKKYNSFEVESSDNPEACCICQEQYAGGEHVGKLDCGHDFHTNCIKQWLLRKNQCPICKEKGLASNQREQ